MKDLPERKQNRLHEYNYSQNGYYFITICTKDREECFGKIIDNKMVLNKHGKIIEQNWLEIANHFPFITLDQFVVMPNHVHGILVIENIARDRHACPLRPQYQKLSVVVGSFKSASSKQIHQTGFKHFTWQRSFYDHIIRNEIALQNIHEYINNNPLNWALEKDRNHLANIKPLK